MRILTVVGNRPQFIKAAAVSWRLREVGEETMVHTGQHYDDELSAIFFEELRIPPPERELGVGSGTNTDQTARMMAALEPELRAVAPDVVLVYGDTNSTLAGAVAGAQAGYPVAHIEAGMRSFDRSMPEELNRVLTDHAAELLLCSTPTAARSLELESVLGEVHLVGDVMADVALRFAPIAEERSQALVENGLQAGEYVLVTAHRAGNVDDQTRLERLVALLEALPMTALFPMHPRTRMRLAQAAPLRERLDRATHVRVTRPLGYLDFLKLLAHARALLTDSGGAQKEAYLLGTPCLTLRDRTEWIETVEAGWNTLVDLDADVALAALARQPPAGSPIRIGVVGLGYWGPNLARNFDRLPGAELRWVCDGSEAALARVAPQFPGVRTSAELEELLADPDLDAVACATPVGTHAEVALRILDAGKHCFVEKPLAQSVAAADQVAAAARASDRVLMVGHLLEYHPGVEKLKEIADSGQLGELFYLYSNRLNLGKLRADENALWSLGAHDVSVVLRLINEEPVELDAFGESYMRHGVEDVVFCHLRFPSGVSAHVHLSWLDPHKERRFTVVGSKRMATFDDMALEQKVTVYDKGFDQDFSSYGEYIARSGDIWSPRISNEEPLRIECRHFLDCVRGGAEPRSGAESGVRVVRVLEELDRSLRARERRAATAAEAPARAAAL